jgi:hypothetical protein
MPIRFRCVYCNKLLGIARRKAGSVVNCPQCAQPLIVPTPEPEPTAAAATVPAAPPKGPSKLFERDDFEAILQGDATLPAPDRPTRRRREDRGPSPLPPKPFPVERSLPAPDDPEMAFAPAPQTRPAGVVLSTAMLVLLVVGVLVLIAVAFGAGIVIGRMLKS